ncbi:MarR family transcriptional regulator [Aquibium carbonis]|uniref:MarR family transcriptional regulator n=1 Tax=Aquibium carbonis TaxID=2495581 RepID=A0A3S0A860_9HYPH|nr:MarR family transcriptional regulator [Aquibium carbonis]RST86021.1 MarR family transcriptional regulator [Aquibium carbonis]
MSAVKALKLVKPEPADYRLQDQVGFVLRKANQRHLAIFATHIGDLTPPQFAALAKLAEVGETSQNQLGTLVAMDAATIKGVIDRLKGRGLVEVRNHDEDRRRIVVSLTQAGSEALARLVPVARAVTEETLSPLTAREAATLMRLLAKMG